MGRGLCLGEWKRVPGEEERERWVKASVVDGVSVASEHGDGVRGRAAARLHGIDHGHGRLACQPLGARATRSEEDFRRSDDGGPAVRCGPGRALGAGEGTRQRKIRVETRALGGEAAAHGGSSCAGCCRESGSCAGCPFGSPGLFRGLRSISSLLARLKYGPTQKSGRPAQTNWQWAVARGRWRQRQWRFFFLDTTTMALQLLRDFV